MYIDIEALAAKRIACMERDFSRATRKAEYLEIYKNGGRASDG